MTGAGGNWNPKKGETGYFCNGLNGFTHNSHCLFVQQSVHPDLGTHTHTHIITHIPIYCTYTNAPFVSLSLFCTRTLDSLVGDHFLSPLIDCLPGITFQTINTIKKPLKPLKPQRTSNHLTIKSHWREKKKQFHHSEPTNTSCFPSLKCPILNV